MLATVDMLHPGPNLECRLKVVWALSMGCKVQSPRVGAFLTTPASAAAGRKPVAAVSIGNTRTWTSDGESIRIASVSPR